MAKYHKLSRQTPLPQRPWAVHPIWRGFGCLLLVVGPFIAFGFAHILVEIDIKQGWFQIPVEMRNTITIPGTINLFDLSLTIGKGGKITHFYADLIFTIVLLLLGFALIMIIYSIIYSLIGPRRYGPVDSPPIRRSQKRRRR